MLIARAIAQGADHLILDEPTNHLDIRYQIEVLELVAGLDVTVLAALHDLSLAALFCDTVYLLTDGRIIACGPPGTVITAETVRRALTAPTSLIVDHPETGTPPPHPPPIPGRRKAPRSLTGFQTSPSASEGPPPPERPIHCSIALKGFPWRHIPSPSFLSALAPHTSPAGRCAAYPRRRQRRC